ncbi:hypothetical protein B0H14DRAFT_2557521 [Mycena olivaceomarginata]|nr:hypothetical protein B0H14DRAFT_2557521 [Mycena olivaceomarginata]
MGSKHQFASPIRATGAVLETTEIFLSNTTAVPSAQAQLSLQRMIQYSSATSGWPGERRLGWVCIATGLEKANSQCPQLESRPGLPTPSAAPRFRGAAARTSRVWLRAVIVFFIQICPSPVADSSRDGANELEIARNPHGSHTSQSTRLACARGREDAKRAERSSSGGAFGGARSVGVARGGAGGGGVGRRTWTGTTVMITSTNTMGTPTVSQRFGCGSRRGEGEGADVGVGAGWELKVVGEEQLGEEGEGEVLGDKDGARRGGCSARRGGTQSQFGLVGAGGRMSPESSGWVYIPPQGAPPRKHAASGRYQPRHPPPYPAPPLSQASSDSEHCSTTILSAIYSLARLNPVPIAIRSHYA